MMNPKYSMMIQNEMSMGWGGEKKSILFHLFKPLGARQS